MILLALAETTPNTLILSGTAVLTVLAGVGYAFKRLYEDNAKAKTLHIESEKRRADEAIERANALDRLLRDYKDGKP